MASSNREQLIEKARVAYVEAWEAENARIENWDRDSRGKHTRSRAGIEAALAVFEEAHTPKVIERHDEREPLATWDVDGMIEGLRSAADSPKDQVAITRQRLLEAAEAIETLTAGFRRTVQGEPTDAQVLAALNARELSVRERSGNARHFNPAPDLSYYSEGNVADMRAALRAAFNETGENRG